MVLLNHVWTCTDTEWCSETHTSVHSAVWAYTGSFQSPAFCRTATVHSWFLRTTSQGLFTAVHLQPQESAPAHLRLLYLLKQCQHQPLKPFLQGFYSSLLASHMPAEQPINVLPLPIEQVQLVAPIRPTSTKQRNHHTITARNVSDIKLVTAVCYCHS